MDLKQKQQLSDGVFHQSHGSFELVFAPVILALVGLALDSWLGLVPVFTVALCLLGAVGAFAKIYYGYRAALDDASARRAGAGLP